nr:MAG TPA: hypothetical protein [Caudoviricetes sp.]
MEIVFPANGTSQISSFDSNKLSADTTQVGLKKYA